MFQFGRSARREKPKNETIRNNKIFILIKTLGNPGAEKRINEIKYRLGRQNDYFVYENPDTQGFFYLYMDKSQYEKCSEYDIMMVREWI